MKRVIIVGAGPCGLVALKEMREAGHKAVVFEKSSKLGGVFSSSTVYPNLHLTISNWAMAFSDFPDSSQLHYSTAEEYLKYLQNYAQKFDLERHINFNSEVCSARLACGTWSIRIRQVQEPGQPLSIFEADALIVATGANQIPNNIPECLAGFTGSILHSSQYDTSVIRKVEKKNLRVLVVGAGESGADISAELGGVSANVTVWMRRAACVGPRYLNRLNEAAQVEDNEAQDYPANGFLEAATTNRMSAGQNVYAYGFFRRMLWHTPVLNQALNQFCLESTSSAWIMNDQATYVTKNQRMYEALGEGKIKAVICPSMTTQGNTCEFQLQDGQRLQQDFDMIILCHGFRTEFPWLKVADLDFDPRSWFLHCFPKGRGDCLFFVGYARPHQGGIPAMAEMLARYIAVLLLGSRCLPSDYAEQAQRDAAAEEEYYHISPQLRTLVDFNAFLETIARRIGCEPRLSMVCIALYNLHMLMVVLIAQHFLQLPVIPTLDLPALLLLWVGTVAGFFLYDDGLIIKWWFYPNWPVWYRQRGPGANPAHLRHTLRRVRLWQSTSITLGFILLVSWSILTIYPQRLISGLVFLPHIILSALHLPFPKAWGGLLRPKMFALHSTPWRFMDLLRP